MFANDENKIDYAFKLSMSIDIAAVNTSDSRQLSMFSYFANFKTTEKNKNVKKISHFSFQGIKISTQQSGHTARQPGLFSLNDWQSLGNKHNRLGTTQF